MTRLSTSFSIFLCLLLSSGFLQARGNLTTIPENSEENPLVVTVGLYISDIDSIKTADQSFEARIFYRVSWNDPRLTFKGDKEKVISLADIWHPKLNLLNRKKVFGSPASQASVSPDGNVWFMESFWGEFSQPLDLKYFPFDRQTFEIIFIMPVFAGDHVVFQDHPQKTSGITDQPSITDWNLSNWKVTQADFQTVPGATKHPSLTYSFEAQRLTKYYYFKIILPLLLIVAMSWAAFWMDPLNVGSNVSVAITSMLTLIAYRFSADAIIPKLPYITSIDYFILGSTLLVFLSLMQVLITSKLAKVNLEKAHKIDWFSRIFFPGAFLVLTLESLYYRSFL